MSHTPGPWFFHDHETETAQVSNSESGHTADGGGGLRVADVWCTDLEGGEDNARLIAAAPELLEACKVALCLLADGISLEEARDNLGADPLPMIREAIAKAEGTE